MGLMLSILIVCVGVIEALSCYEHFQYGVIHCATNVYEKARRRSSVFLKYTSRRLKLLPESSMLEEPDKILEPSDLVHEIRHNSGNFRRREESEADHFGSKSLANNFDESPKKLEDKIQIVKKLLEKPARPKAVRSISMPELMYTERDKLLSEIINNLANEPIEEINIEIEDANTEILIKEFDELFDEYGNTSKDDKEIHNSDENVIKSAEDEKCGRETKLYNETNEFSEKVESRKNIEKLVSEPVKINFTHSKNAAKFLEKDEKGSPCDRFTSADLGAFTPFKSNKSKSVDLDVAPPFYKFNDESSATEIFIKESPILKDSNNKLDDAIFENDTPPTEVIDKTFEKIYNDICDESMKEEREYEDIEKSILNGFECDAKTDSESKIFEDGQILHATNQSEEKILSNNCGVLEETISNGVILKAVEQLAELIVKDSLNLNKIKNLIFEDVNYKVGFTQEQNQLESQEVLPNGQLTLIVQENATEGENPNNIGSQEPKNDENKKNQFTEEENYVFNEQDKIQKISDSDSGREISNASSGNIMEVNPTEFDTVVAKAGTKVLEKASSENSSAKNSDEVYPDLIGEKVEEIVDNDFEPAGIRQNDAESPITQPNDINDCYEIEIRSVAPSGELKENDDYLKIKEESYSNLKEDSEAIIQSELSKSSGDFLIKYETFLALEHKEIKPEKTIPAVQDELENSAVKLPGKNEKSEKISSVKSDILETEICTERHINANLGQPTENPESIHPEGEEIKFNDGKKETKPAEHKVEKNMKEIETLQLVGSSVKLKESDEFSLNFSKEEPENLENIVKKNDNSSDFIEEKTKSSTDSINELNDRNNEVKAAESTPEAFWLIFSGEYTKAMSKDWHSGHFSCWQCDEALTGQRYVLRDDHPYCIKCYESVFANVCEECNKIIGIDSKDLSYKDKHWHEACFLCNKCRVSLVDKQFGSKADKIYCGNCYDAQFASRCDGCGEIFRAGTKKMEYKTRQWHEKCFCCCVCKTPIGTKSFIPREQEIYCATCYEEKFATRCVKCNKIITSGGVTYKNEPWHRECFTCTNCNTSLAGQRFTSRDEKPYCADCFGELFAKRCTACSRPITGIGGTRFISFEDRHWHNDCFICASCKTSLVGRGFITDGDDIICPECAKQKLM